MFPSTWPSLALLTGYPGSTCPSSLLEDSPTNRSPKMPSLYRGAVVSTHHPSITGQVVVATQTHLLKCRSNAFPLCGKEPGVAQHTLLSQKHSVPFQLRGDSTGKLPY
jgi:hypothetical protein